MTSEQLSVFQKDFPLDSFNQVIAFLTGSDKDQGKFIYALYNLVGFGLHIFLGEPDQAKVMSQVLDFTAKTDFSKLPPWLLPLLQELIKAFLLSKVK